MGDSCGGVGGGGESCGAGEASGNSGAESGEAGASSPAAAAFGAAVASSGSQSHANTSNSGTSNSGGADNGSDSNTAHANGSGDTNNANADNNNSANANTQATVSIHDALASVAASFGSVAPSMVSTNTSNDSTNTDSDPAVQARVSLSHALANAGTGVTSDDGKTQVSLGGDAAGALSGLGPDSTNNNDNTNMDQQSTVSIHDAVNAYAASALGLAAPSTASTDDNSDSTNTDANVQAVLGIKQALAAAGQMPDATLDSLAAPQQAPASSAPSPLGPLTDDPIDPPIADPNVIPVADNQRENKKAGDAAKAGGLTTKDELRAFHDAITKQGITDFDELVDIAKSIKDGTW